jgi:hypothetical protein
MRITAYAVSMFLVGTLFSAQQTTQDTKRHGAAEERSTFATNRCVSKGGVGIVNTSLYIVVKSSQSDSNELIVKPTEETEERWKGKDVTKAEVVFVYEGKVWAPPQSLPKGFDLSKAVIISFEGQKIRFFDFRATVGGYYDRFSS